MWPELSHSVINNDAYIIAKILRLQDHIPSEIDANTLITTNDGQGVKKSPENVTSTQKDHEQQNNHGKSILRSLVREFICLGIRSSLTRRV